MTTKVEAIERVQAARLHAIKMMKEAGYGLTKPVEVTVDPKLPFMGYTMPQNSGFKTVVAGGALESGMIEGLLIHEMSHIYRMQTNHPSHNPRIIDEAINSLGKDALTPSYKAKIIHDVINDIEDLYADDLAFKVFRKNGLFPAEQASSFLQDWVNSQPIKTRNRERDSWANTALLAKNARAIGQMTRHKVVDTDAKAANANRQFLSQMPSPALAHYEYFLNFLTNLSDDLTEDAYRQLLSDYLHRFVAIAEGSA